MARYSAYSAGLSTNFMTTKSKTIAAIDLGSNSFRLLIKRYHKSAGHWQGEQIASDMHTVRLGEGLQQTGYLSEQAMARGLTACRIFSKLLSKYTPTVTALRPRSYARVCGTEALRVASNNMDFIAAAQKILGLPIEILTPEGEAKLTIQGCTEDSGNDKHKAILLVDAGGCSTEIILINGTDAPVIRSLPIGALSVTEKFITNMPESAAELKKLTSYLHKVISPTLQDFLAMSKPGYELRLMAAGGTATTMAALDLDLHTYQASLIQGHQITGSGVQKMAADIAKLPLAERLKLPGLAKRGSIFLAGIKIYQTIMAIGGFDSITISASGLLEGMLRETIYHE
jgi:exopolyphosphatase/guanosine-5'-triphosphate,3'-diphosphate pyrophosphatase